VGLDFVKQHCWPGHGQDSAGKAACSTTMLVHAGPLCDSKACFRSACHDMSQHSMAWHALACRLPSPVLCAGCAGALQSCGICAGGSSRWCAHTRDGLSTTAAALYVPVC
jgi:hypothetical protein